MTTQALQSRGNGAAPRKSSVSPEDAFKTIESHFRAKQRAFDRMDKDYLLYTLKEWMPDFEESVAPEDTYTTNAPRVLADKIIAFIAATETIIRVPNDHAQEQQERANDLTEELSIGMLNNVNRRLRRRGDPELLGQLAWFSVVRGRYCAARAVLRKRENGDTYEDILPLDPRHLVIETAEEEPVWAAYRMSWSKRKISEEFPGFKFRDEPLDPDEPGYVYEYYRRDPNPNYEPLSEDPFDRHPYIYRGGTLVDSQWARPLHDLFMFSFPVVLAPVTSQPQLAPAEGEGLEDTDEHFGESVFAENRHLWDKLNRVTSYTIDLVAKQSDPRKKVYSLDGTKALDEGASDKGAEINLSTANQEEVENFDEADIHRAAGLLLQQLQNDAVAGGLPPQAFGLLDKPLSSVALRQLGNNLEHRVLPRLRAVAKCIEGCLENLVSQYETGAFAPITVSGRRFDNQRFANRIIEPEHIFGHDPVEVQMDLALPEDEVSRWTVAQMAMQPTVTGEPLASLEWTRERILKMQSAKTITSQNREVLGIMQDPLAQAQAQVMAYLGDGDQANASIWFDRLQVLQLQRQVEAAMAIQQLTAMAMQIGVPLGQGQPQSTVGGQQPSVPLQNNSRNPANGAVPFAAAAGVGNSPSPQAGFNTTAPRQSQGNGLVGPDGEPIGG